MLVRIQCFQFEVAQCLLQTCQNSSRVQWNIKRRRVLFWKLVKAVSTTVEKCPEILPASIRKDFELTGLSHQMIRRTTLELVSTLNKVARLDSLTDSLPPCHLKQTSEGLWPALRMEGRYGLGKSTQLVSMIEYAEQRDALILYIPRVQVVTEGFGRGNRFSSCYIYIEVFNCCIGLCVARILCF